MFAPDESQKNISMRDAVGGTILIAAAAFFAGTVFGGSTNTPTAAIVGLTPLGDGYSAPTGVDFTPVWKAWTVIDEQYVPGKVATTTIASTTPNGANDPQERVWGMIQGLAASLGDPYTVFMPPADAEIFESDIQGNFEGVGMEIAIRDSVLTIVSPLKNTPASRAGLKAGDRITKIDGVETRGISIDVAVKRIRGPKGTTVTLSILRESEPDTLEIKVVRDVIDIPTIETELRTDGIFIIELYNFSAVSPALFRDALRQFIESGSSKLLLDLRGNPGGFLEAAVDLASWFLPSGEVVVTEDYADKQDNIIHRSRGYDVFNENLRMVIVVDRGSASASEILAGALQHYRVAQVVGESTFGKGSVQELVPITGDTSLKITVARWLMPSGKQIPNEGLAPDVEVKSTDEETEKGIDAQLNRAVEILLKGE